MNIRWKTGRLYRIARYFRYTVLLSVILTGSLCYGSEINIVDKQKNMQEKPVLMTSQDDTISANIPSATLGEVMEEFSRLTGIKVLWKGADKKSRISAGFTDLRVDDAITYLLSRENYMIVYASRGKGQDIEKILLLPGSKDASIAAATHIPSVDEESITTGNFEESVLNEFAAMDKMKAERMSRISDVRNIIELDDKEEAETELIITLSTNDDPEARLRALNDLNEMGDVSTDSLIETVTHDSDRRVQLQAIDYLLKRADEDPAIGEFLSSFFEDHREPANE
jgi:hypothetical protein